MKEISSTSHPYEMLEYHIYPIKHKNSFFAPVAPINYQPTPPFFFLLFFSKDKQEKKGNAGFSEFVRERVWNMHF